MCRGGSSGGTSAMNIRTAAGASTEILRIVFICCSGWYQRLDVVGASRRMNVIGLAPLGGTKLNRAAATAGATFQSLMTVVTLSRPGVPVSVTTYLHGSGRPL